MNSCGLEAEGVMQLSYIWTFQLIFMKLFRIYIYCLCRPLESKLMRLASSLWMALFRPLAWWVPSHISVVFLLFGASKHIFPPPGIRDSFMEFHSPGTLQCLSVKMIQNDWHILVVGTWANVFLERCLFVWSNIMLLHSWVPSTTIANNNEVTTNPQCNCDKHQQWQSTAVITGTT